MIDFVVATFDAVVRGRVPNADGTIGHAELTIGDSLIMLFDASDDWPHMPALLSVYVEDCDRTHDAAVAAGATVITPMMTSAWGDRGCRVRDPFGNIWWILTHVEDVPDDEIFRRMSEPEYVEVMRVAQGTFDDAMRSAR
jgi:PhnB protein